MSENKEIQNKFLQEKIFEVYKPEKDNLIQILNEVQEHFGYIPKHVQHELSEFLNISLDDIDYACSSASLILSLDSENEDEKDMYECLGKSEDLDTKILIDDSFEVLTDDEKNIIKSRYFEDLTQSEVAKKLNMTQVMVSRYEKKSIDKLREYLSV